MSSSTYTLKIDIDDSKIREIEKRLMNIVGGSQSGGLGAKVTGASSGGSMGKNIAKLGMIATGVIGILMFVKKIAEMTVSSSPMLQQMLKLMNFGVMLILRPIGDFFGFFLRPLIVFFLRSIILPWYRLARPIMQKFGQWLGMGATKNLNSNLTGAWALITGDWDTVAKLSNEGVATLMANWDSFTEGLDNWATDLKFPTLSGMSETVTTWIDSLDLPTLSGFADGIVTWISDQAKLLPSFGGLIFTIIGGWLIWEGAKLPTFDYLVTEWNAWITKITGKLPTLEDVAASITAIGVAISAIGTAIRDALISLAEKFGIDLTGILGKSSTTTTTTPTNGYDNNQTNTDIYPWLTDNPMSKISDETRGQQKYG